MLHLIIERGWNGLRKLVVNWVIKIIIHHGGIFYARDW